MQVNVVVEGITDEPVAIKILEHVGLETGTIFGRSGKEHLLKTIHAYNNAASISPWLALVDLDTSTQCASQARLQWLPRPATFMCFRIAVHSIEAWLLADREAIANFLSVNLTKIPYNVENEHDPKKTLVNIARKSRDRNIRNDIVPRQESGARVGPLYVARITDYTLNHWRPDEAAKNSESLSRCIKALSALAAIQ